MPTQLGVPVKLLHECEGHKISVELTNGEIYRGLMVDAEDCWNLQMQQVTLTARDGKISKLDYVYIRGSKIRLIILPDMLKNAPLFKRFDVKNKVSKIQPGLGFGFGGIQSAVGGRGRGGPPGRGRGRGQ